MSIKTTAPIPTSGRPKEEGHASDSGEFVHDTPPVWRQDQAAMAAMRAIVEPNKGMLRGTAARGTFDAIMERVAAPEGVAYEADMVGGVPGSARSSESRLYSLVRTSAL